MPAGAGIPTAANMLFRRGELKRDERLTKESRFHSAIQAAIDRKKQHEDEQRQRRKEKRSRNIKIGAMAAGAVAGAVAAPAIFAGGVGTIASTGAGSMIGAVGPTTAQTLLSTGLGASLGGMIAEGDTSGIANTALTASGLNRRGRATQGGIPRDQLIRDMDAYGQQFASMPPSGPATPPEPIGVNPEVIGAEPAPPTQPIAPTSILQPRFPGQGVP